MYYCIDCDYTMTRDYFDAGKGRIMFSAGKGLKDGTFRCGVCDDRCDDPEGMFPNDESKEDEEGDEPECCVGCGIDGKFPENRDGDTMCWSCMSDEDESCSECEDEDSDESEEDEEKTHKLKLKQVLDELLLLEMSVAQYDDSCKFIRWKDYLRKDFYDQQH